MDKIENIARIKTNDIKRLELARKRMKITGTFISRCLGLSETTWSGWVTQRGSIPPKYLDQVVNVFQTIDNLIEGKRCLPVADNQTKQEKADLSLVFDFLEEVANPKVPIFGDKHEELERLVRRFSEDAKALLELMDEENEKD